MHFYSPIKLALLLVSLSFVLAACAKSNDVLQSQVPTTIGSVKEAWAKTDRYRVEGDIALPQFTGVVSMQVDMPDKYYLAATEDNGGASYQVIKAGRNFYKRVGGEAWNEVEGVDELSFNHRQIIEDFFKSSTVTGRIITKEKINYTRFEMDKTGDLAGHWSLDVDLNSSLPAFVNWGRGDDILASFRVYDYGATDFLIVEPEI